MKMSFIPTQNEVGNAFDNDLSSEEREIGGFTCVRKRSLLADDEAKEMKEEFCDVVKSLLIPLDSMLLNEDDKDVDSWIRSNRSSFFTIR